MSSATKNIRQLDQEDCGAACIAYVAAHYGLMLPITQIREVCGTDTGGTTLKGLTDAAIHYGFEARAFKSPEKNHTDLKEIPLPAILHFQRPDGWLHFVVLTGYHPKYLTIWDPDGGKSTRYSHQDLSAHWSGYLLLLIPGDAFVPGGDKRSWTQRTWQLIQRHRHEWRPALAGSIAYATAGITSSLFLQILLDQVLPNEEYPLLFLIGSFMLVLVILSWITAYYRSLFVVRTGIQMDGGLVLSYLRHLFQLPLSFFDHRSCGELNARIGDAFRIRAFVSGRLLILSISLLSLILSFTLLISFCPKLALIIFSFLPGYALLYSLGKRLLKKHNRGAIEKAAQFEATCLESISRIRIAKLFDAEPRFIRRIEKAYTQLSEQLYRSGQTSSHLLACSEGLSRLQSTCLLVLGGKMVLEGGLSLGELVAFYSLTNFFTTPILHLIESTQSLSEAQIAADRLFEIQEFPIETTEGLLPSETLPPFQTIRFQDVDFHYPGRLPLFRNFSHTFHKGRITVISGRSGCGKSTLAALLLRTLSPTKGHIFLDDIDLQHINLKDWRSFISIVPQQAELFQGTILENIAPNESQPNLPEINALCHLLHVDELLQQLPKHLLTPITEGGFDLSGGERQKLALIRALYRKPEILVLDESSAHLDKSDRQQWKQIIRNLADHGKTILLISHEQEVIQWGDDHLDMEELMRISKGGRLRT